MSTAAPVDTAAYSSASSAEGSVSKRERCPGGTPTLKTKRATRVYPCCKCRRFVSPVDGEPCFQCMQAGWKPRSNLPVGIDPRKLALNANIPVLEQAYQAYYKHIGYVQRLRDMGIPCSFEHLSWKDGFDDALYDHDYKNLYLAMDWCCIDEESFQRMARFCPKLPVQKEPWFWAYKYKGGEQAQLAAAPPPPAPVWDGF